MVVGKKCARHIPNGIVGYDQYPVPDTVAFEPTLLLSLSTCKHTSMASTVILTNFFEEQRTQNHTQYLLALLHALFFSENFSQNSCINIEPWLPVNKSQSNIVKPPKSDHQKYKELKWSLMRDSN